MQLFPSMKNPLTKKYFAMKNFAKRSSIYENASGSLLWNGYKAIAEGGNRHCFVAFSHFCFVTTSRYLSLCIKEWEEKELFN